MAASKNIDAETVESFGAEWSHYSQSALDQEERDRIFSNYFSVFPWTELPADAEGFDMGCGSGRWADCVAPKVAHLHCIDASQDALSVARKNLESHKNLTFHNASVDEVALPLASQDFGYSLGVLHHIPDTAKAMRSCTSLLKPGAPFLVYLYYRFDNRPAWFRAIWKASELLRGVISRLPNSLKNVVTDLIALLVYWPLARLAKLLSVFSIKAESLPLYGYRDYSFYTMRTDSRDRFGTPLEQRFTRVEITKMMQNAGLENVVVSEGEPYWCAVGKRIAI
ncbi:MAG: class I SAM-dependent methyltransferase [Pseudomonadota bacterium]